MRPLALAAVLGILGCSSTAPYTVPAALINSAVAVGAAGASRQAGGCVATCTHGTTCNPRTGLCEREHAPVDGYCEPDPGGGTRCLGLDLGVVARDRSGESPAGGSGVQVVPAPAPPPPAEASPGRGR